MKPITPGNRSGAPFPDRVWLVYSRSAIRVTHILTARPRVGVRVGVGVGTLW